MSRSQWLVIAGGAALIVGTFAPLFVVDWGPSGSEALTMLGAKPQSGPFHRYPHEVGVHMPAVLAVCGGVTMLYAALSILLSTWWSSARVLLWPAIVFDAMLLLGFVVVVSIVSEPHSSAVVGWGWIPLFAGSTSIVIGSIFDLRQYQKITVAPQP